jgi:hypothetical protein
MFKIDPKQIGCEMKFWWSNVWNFILEVSISKSECTIAILLNGFTVSAGKYYDVYQSCDNHFFPNYLFAIRHPTMQRCSPRYWQSHKVNHKVQNMAVWIGSYVFKIWSTGRILWTRLWTLEFHSRRRISCLPERLISF